MLAWMTEYPGYASYPLSALSFLFVIIVPLRSYDEPKVSLIQTTQLVRVSLTGNNPT